MVCLMTCYWRFGIKWRLIFLSEIPLNQEEYKVYAPQILDLDAYDRE